MTHGGSGGDVESEFHLPDEILAVMPSDPYEQLDLARKITSMAIASRVSKLDLEAVRLRQTVAEKDQTIANLQERISQLDRMFQETDARLKAALEENITLADERDSLAQTSKKLARDLAKLETFKKQLLLSLNDDNLPVSEHTANVNMKQQDTVDIQTDNSSVAYSSSYKDEISFSGPVPYSASGSMDFGGVTLNATKPFGQKPSKTPPIHPRLTPPTTTPKVTSTSGSPRKSAVVTVPKYASGAASPTNTHFENLTAMSPWYPSSKQSSAASSPPRGRSISGRTPRVDGKEFFRQARSRLSYEQFGAFLANIKELNAHRQSREETLRKAEEIFGTKDRDLFLSFQGLLSRNQA
ncbi:uncharacterized protein At4g15545-like isoform X1 [Zingiber officinale]|uniref:At4g15545-like C-terminal domain-containing protein n=1 Tax=Zingiber officinale TaxID=94328 RepID=A0A8J5CF91_ZINOF|nr:uncharacterized protein At4g15545-like isoform X1 [Zingiber officinale]KAG6473136.1 hypothetical protein ZIOFF_067043 [Zingiber officinale]